MLPQENTPGAPLQSRFCRRSSMISALASPSTSSDQAIGSSTGCKVPPAALHSVARKSSGSSTKEGQRLETATSSPRFSSKQAARSSRRVRSAGAPTTSTVSARLAEAVSLWLRRPESSPQAVISRQALKNRIRTRMHIPRSIGAGPQDSLSFILEQLSGGPIHPAGRPPAGRSGAA